MSKINSFLPPNYSILFSLSLIGVIIIFILLEPKVSSLFFPWRREAVLQSFEAKTQSKQQIEPQEFWEFREFYSPGYFIVDKNGLSTSELSANKNIFNLHGKYLPVDIFNSNKVKSLEALVESEKLTDFIRQPNIKSLLNSPNQIMYNSGNYLFVEFIMPISQMQKANGFFDYTGDDKEMLKGKFWLSVSRIQEN